MKINNLLVDAKIFSLCRKETIFLYFKRIFRNISNISRNSGPLYSQINFDQIYFFLGGEGLFSRGFWHGGFCLGAYVQGGCLGSLCPRTLLLTKTSYRYCWSFKQRWQVAATINKNDTHHCSLIVYFY